MVEATAEAASPSRERQSMYRLWEKIFRHIHWQQVATIRKAPAAKGQTREATSYYYRTLLSDLGNWKKCSKSRLTGFHVRTPSI